MGGLQRIGEGGVEGYTVSAVSFRLCFLLSNVPAHVKLVLNFLHLFWFLYHDESILLLNIFILREISSFSPKNVRTRDVT